MRGVLSEVQRVSNGPSGCMNLKYSTADLVVEDIMYYSIFDYYCGTFHVRTAYYSEAPTGRLLHLPPVVAIFSELCVIVPVPAHHNLGALFEIVAF